MSQQNRSQGDSLFPIQAADVMDKLPKQFLLRLSKA